jgi:pimeloyl-ACP methyl ester carboxylesterase
LILRIFGGFAALIVLLLSAGFLYESYALSSETARHRPPGQMVDIGGRKIHLLCKGEGSGPTVVIEPGAAEPAMLWWAVQDQIGGFARVCTYDRAGYQWSDPAPSGRSIEARAEDLRRVLSAAKVPGPYVLVAHSYGGAVIRPFVRDNRSAVAGLVLVDTPDEMILFGPQYASVVGRGSWLLPIAALAMRCGVFRVLSAFAPDDDSAVALSAEARRLWPMAFRPAMLDAAADDMSSILSASAREKQVRMAGELGDLPLVVVAHGIPFPDSFAGLEPGFRESQHRLAALSTKGRLVIAARSNHNIQMDQPQIVVDAVRAVVDAAKAR